MSFYIGAYLLLALGIAISRPYFDLIGRPQRSLVVGLLWPVLLLWAFCWQLSQVIEASLRMEGRR